MGNSGEWSWQSGPMRQPWFSLFMGLVSLILLGTCTYSAYEARTFANDAISTLGTVVELRRDRETSRPSSRPIIEFVDYQGKTVRIISKVSSYPPAFDIGEKVEVIYPSNSPEEARIDSFREKWFVSLLTGVLGAFMLAGSVSAWIFRKRLFPQYARGLVAKGTKRNASLFVK